MQNLDDDELVEVYRTGDPNTAEIIRNALADEGIASQPEGENQAGLAGISSMAVKIFVRAEDHDRARAFIEEHLRKHGQD